MAYETPTFDTSQRNKMMQQLDQFYNIPQYQQMLQSQGRQALQQNFGAAQDRIGAQFQPVQRMATARLAGSPLLADSGYANRLNRQIQTSAFGDLSNAYGQASADNANSQLSALQRLMQARWGATDQMFGNAQKKTGGTGSVLGGILGAGIGAFGGPLLGAAGAQIGKRIGGGST